MAQEGLKKKDKQRAVQKVHVGAAISSASLDGTTTTDRVELGFPAEKLTLVCTGDLACTVQPMVGPGNSHTAINATTTPSTTTLSHMAAAVMITRTGGSGKLIILAK